MRTIGLIGGMSWESTAVYYRLLNEGVRDRLGGLHSADLLLRSFDFDEIAAMLMPIPEPQIRTPRPTSPASMRPARGAMSFSAPFSREIGRAHV